MPFAEFGDNRRIFYDRIGAGTRSILFIHGWLGSSKWWTVQKDFFKDNYTIVCMDLPGHGKSSEFKTQYSSQLYSESIKTVIQHAHLEETFIVAHSMSAPFALHAATGLSNVRGVVLVDTLKNIEQHMNHSQAEELLFRHYREDFKNAVENILPNFLFTSETPEIVRCKVQNEFLKCEYKKAIELIEPLYNINLTSLAQKVFQPVVAMNSDFTPTNVDGNCKYFTNYSVRYLSGTGHYPMLEDPDQFNHCLGQLLKSIQEQSKVGVDK